MMSLERELGFQIFIRNNKGVTLTNEGKSLYQYARTILRQADLISLIGTRESIPTLTVASYPILTASRLLGLFYRNHDEKEISLHLIEQRLKGVIKSVGSGTAEIGLILYSHVQQRDVKKLLSYNNLEYNHLAMDTWYADVGPNSPLYDREEVNIRELIPFPITRMPDDYFATLNYYNEVDSVPFFSFKRVIYLSDMGSILHLIRSTDVFRFGPTLSNDDLAEYGIRAIPIHNCDIEIHIGWIRRKKAILSPEAEEFVEILKTICVPEI